MTKSEYEKIKRWFWTKEHWDSIEWDKEKTKLFIGEFRLDLLTYLKGLVDDNL